MHACNVLLYHHFLHIDIDPSDFPSTTHDIIFSPDNRTSRYECEYFTIYDDSISEEDETFSITLTSDDPAVVIDEECDEATVTIVDDDSTYAN